MPDGLVDQPPGQRNRPAVHSEPRLVPTEAFLRTQEALNNHDIQFGRPKRLVEKECEHCGAPPNWRTQIDRPVPDEHSVAFLGDEYAAEAL